MTARIASGVLVIERRSVSAREYAADNNGDTDKMLVIEHPIRQGWKLVDTQQPFETIPAVYRFQGTAVANKVTTLLVGEEIANSEQFSLLQWDVGQLLSNSRSGEIPGAVRDALGKAAQLRQAGLETERQIDDRAKQVGAITQEQTRIRENMKTVDAKTQYYTRLLDKLNEQESSIEKLQQERVHRGRDSTPRVSGIRPPAPANRTDAARSHSKDDCFHGHCNAATAPDRAQTA